MEIADMVLISILAGGGAFILFAVLRRRGQIAINVKPPELIRMMRRYEIDARDAESTDFSNGFTCACRNCEECERKEQCREWLELSLPTDIPLFCRNEEFLHRVKHPTTGNPRPARTALAVRHFKSGSPGCLLSTHHFNARSVNA